MTPKQISLVQETWAKVKPIAPQAADIFYNTLFEMDPSLKPLFKNDMTEQGNKLMTMLDTAVKLLNSPDKLIPAVEKLGVRHVDYGVTAAHYDTVGAALLKTLAAGLGDAFTPTVKKAWTAVYTVLATTMIAAADASIAEKKQSTGTTMSNSNSEQNAFIQAALEQSGIAVMMIDRDFIITYANESTMKLLKTHEATFQKKWPTFVANKDDIMGFCIDGFHENPAHQRELLADPNNLPYSTDIQIEHLIMELNVTAIMNADNKYVGNSLEWSDVTDIRASTNKAIQLQGAIDQSNTPSMMIDRDFIITYANKATFALLKENEEVFAAAFPGFKADEDAIIGACIDGFHKNPAHQRKLLDDPNNLPWQTDIQVQHLTFELNVTAIIDAAGNYIGNALEWSNVTKERVDSNKAIQLQGAIDQSNTPNMMIDRDFIITYANKATMKLLKDNEETFAKSFPGFKADEEAIIGACIDGFHKNPAHQRKILDDPNNLPWQTDIQVQHLTFELNVTAIIDAAGEYIGNSLEWSDVTQVRVAADKSIQLQGAIDQSNTATMMIDRDFLITYGNKATFALLKKNEETFAKSFPGFKGDEGSIIGACIDGFHKNPAHQRKLLDDPNNLPWQTDIQVQHLTFSLNVTAIMDAAGEYIGNSLEWSDVTQVRVAADKAAQLQGAIDQSNTPSMMIDRDFLITYANKATFALLKKNEETFAKSFPGFKADEEAIIGACIDGFHKNPAHQRKLLDDPNNLPWQTDIQVQHLIFSLNVTAIMDSEGNYIGNSLEWDDVTQVRSAADKAVQLQGAIDQSNTATMMIDRDFLITYGNKATFALLKENEEVFAKAFPGFKADEDSIIGACIDGFHKNPAHQRKLLDDPNNLPWQTDIKVMHLTFELNVTAIMDAAGEYIGNSLEWQNVTAAREKSIEVGRLSSALEGMTTNVMMADTTGLIVYANPSVCKMLKRREAKIQTVLPSFSVATMVGTNFDSFHANPAHQQNLLGNPDNLPYDTEISLVGLTFGLIAIALRDEEGNHVGTAVQWLDLTEERDAQGQVESMISDAISGQLDTRIETSDYTGFMKGLGDNINGLMDAIVDPINEAINVAQALSDGDLSQTMDGDYAGEFLALADAMNGSIENLNNMVTEIRSASTNVFDSSREIAEGNNELSHRTESQASSLEETASAMEELTSTVQQNAENASEASRLSSSVMTKASSGGDVVKNAITAMSDINKSSKKIADIISVIDEIAFQTNLLALNAAVEAARAGEQGRGFAVVAAEVRNLAQRSAGAAKEIKGLINDSVEAVGQGTKLVDETGQTFTELVTAIEEVGKMIGDIDSAGKEQSAGIGEVSAAVSQMDEMTQQNAALVEEAAASSKSMEEQSQALLDQVAFFNNGEEEAPEIKSPARRSRPSVRKPARPAARTAPKPKGKRSKTETDQEWEEF